ncbi:MAG: ferritin family protein [Deltaproteobacteria bacterium]|nr:ferritin family protein [Deltaproteobacteria bacterium]
MDRISSIKIAMDNEQREEDFYLEEAKRSSNPVVIKLMKKLAAEEEDHKAWISKLHDKLVSDGEWPKDVEIGVEDSTIEEELKKLDFKDNATSVHDDSDIACLKKAIAFEKDAENFYNELAKKCENPQEAGFFKFLAKTELEHGLSIADSLAYLEDPEAWFSSKERAGLDG